MLSDLRIAFRTLLKAPGFTGVSVLILMLGIGAVTTVFSVVESVLLRPLPYAQPKSLYVIQSAAATEVGLFSIPEYCTYRDENRSFQGLAAASNLNTNLIDHGEAELVQGLRISASAFQILGVQAAAGRLLVPDDDRLGSPKVMVIGYGLWQRSFGGRPDVVGRTVSIDGELRTIVGILPASFILPIVGFHNDICVPIQTEADPARHQHGSLHYLRVFGRLAPGVSSAQATADLDSVLNDLRKHFPKEYNGYGRNQLVPLTAAIVGDSRPTLLMLFGAVAGLLLIAGINLAGLHLVRAIGRLREFAVRTALGASRVQLMRLAVAECLVLALIGGAAGLVLADWGVHVLLAFVPADLPRGQLLELNGTIFLFAALISLGFGLAPALAPIWLLSRTDLRAAMASGGRGATGSQRRIRHLLASIQVALALALLAGTGLLLRSFWAVGEQNLGFEGTHVLTVRLSLPRTGYDSQAALYRHQREMTERLTAIPGVEAVGSVSLLPLAPGLATARFLIDGRPAPRDADIPSANYRLASPGYQEAMKIPLRQGRWFTERDDPDHPLAAVIGGALADAYFPHGDAVGQRLQIEDTVTGFRTALIVGVVGTVKEATIEEPPAYDVYIPYHQMDPVAVNWLRYRNYWVLRAAGPRQGLETALRNAVRSEDSAIAISGLHTLDEVAGSAKAARRFTLMVVSFFATSALLLTIAGIYSVIAFGAAQRTREIGVRLALGAQTDQIFALILREGLAIAAVGALFGLAAALLLSQSIASQLYGVSPHDPETLAAAALIVGVIGAVAGWLPARRAARLNPIVALHAE